MNSIEKLGIKIADRDLEFIERELWARLHKRRIVNFLTKQDDQELKDVALLIKNSTVSVFPQKFKDKYELHDVDVKKNENGLFYTVYDGRKLFLKKKYKSRFRAQRYLNNIFMEQDPQSPHKYLSDSFHPQKNDIVFDIGGAEGIFAISYIDQIKKLYIFECDPDWVEALKNTYKDYSEKVCIIEKYVSDFDDETHICLDTFVHDNELLDDDLFIKIDAEGSEPLIIKGAENLLKKTRNIRLALCTYHSADHEKMFREKFSEWNIEASAGYMFYYYDYNIKEPYLRKGLLRLTKKNAD